MPEDNEPVVITEEYLVEGLDKENKWQFDGDVTAVFDDMLERSIPQYEVMRQACFEVGSHFQRDGQYIVDLGASRGGAVAPFVDRYGAHNSFTFVEVSEPMLETLRTRFKGMIDAGVVEVLDLDLRDSYPARPACITLCVLTLQFTPIEHRQRILRNVWENTLEDGCLILVEKVLGWDAMLADLMVDVYYDHKRKEGYTEDQIQRKRLALEGVLVPVTARWNEELLRMAGFKAADCFWRWMNFAAWVAVK